MSLMNDIFLARGLNQGDLYSKTSLENIKAKVDTIVVQAVRETLPDAKSRCEKARKAQGARRVACERGWRRENGDMCESPPRIYCAGMGSCRSPEGGCARACLCSLEVYGSLLWGPFHEQKCATRPVRRSAPSGRVILSFSCV